MNLMFVVVGYYFGDGKIPRNSDGNRIPYFIE